MSAVALDDAGGLFPRLTLLHVELRDRGSAGLRYTKMLQAFVAEFHLSMARAIHDVDRFSPESQAFVEACRSRGKGVWDSGKHTPARRRRGAG